MAAHAVPGVNENFTCHWSKTSWPLYGIAVLLAAAHRMTATWFTAPWLVTRTRYWWPFLHAVKE
jgi:hypothetical protein